jgi:triphosphoribosyl-dephospho-CoA synthase
VVNINYMDINEKIGLAAELACLLEVSAEKPGNVTPTHDFKDTKYHDFLVSAVAIGKAFRNISSASVGETILQAVKDTRSLTNVNTNLGIILLLAPIAKAYTLDNKDDIRARLRSVLESLTVKDAELTYEAIRLANPGGLGKTERHDISEKTINITLLEAMREACHRDSVANEYVTNFEITFKTGLPALGDAIKKDVPVSEAIIHTFLTILSQVPDTLIARKLVVDKSMDVSDIAKKVLAYGGIFNQKGRDEINKLDTFLRKDNHDLNPGTTADLIAAVLFVYLMENDLKIP